MNSNQKIVQLILSNRSLLSSNRIKFASSSISSQKEDNIDEKAKKSGSSYSEKIVLGYSCEQLCDVVSDVAKYREFVPFCTNSEILNDFNETIVTGHKINLKTINKVDDLHQRRLGRYLNLETNKRQLQIPQSFSARLEIGYPPIKESYISNVTSIRPKYVKAISRDTHLFQYLINEWRFQPYIISDNAREDEACLVEFYVTFKFHSVLYAALSQIFMENVFHTMVKAFTDRASVLYGKASIAPIKIK